MPRTVITRVTETDFQTEEIKAVEALYGKSYSTFLRHWDKGIRPC